jgi:DNA-binding NtrC family response regulator
MNLSTEIQAPVASSTRTPVLIMVGDAALGGAPPLGAGRIVTIGAAGLLAGRNAETEGDVTGWRLTHRRASGKHARIQRHGNLCILEDLGSTNGTLRNGVMVRGPTPLADGDFLYLGAHAAVFRWLSAEDQTALSESAQNPMGPTITASPATAAGEVKLRRMARSEHEILLVGETGVGKEVYAEAIHKASARTGPLVAVNCAALPGDLIESELFGYVRGAHSQATQSKRGLIEEAEGGTLFLDELGDMPQTAQAKLLRFLQSREIVPLGATRGRRMDVRVLAATSRPGGGNGSPGLREDLVGRMGAAAFTLPPLRARREDLGALMSFFLTNGHRVPSKPLDPVLFLALCLHPWQRNVRELKKVIETAVLLGENAAELGLSHVPEEIAALVTEYGTAPTRISTSAPPVEDDEGEEVDLPSGGRVRRRSPRPMPNKEALEAMLTKHQGNLSEVARELDRHWKVIKRAVDQHGIDVDSFRA